VLVRRSLTLGLVAVASLVAATSASAIRAVPKLPAGWSHAEINVIIKHKPHTLIYDRGRVLSVTAASLTVREQDGSTVTIDVSPDSRVTIGGRPASLSQVIPREIATTVRVDGGPASKVTVKIPRAVAAALARQARQQARQARLQSRATGKR
jgi:hypothetical protein